MSGDLPRSSALTRTVKTVPYFVRLSLFLDIPERKSRGYSLNTRLHLPSDRSAKGNL